MAHFCMCLLTHIISVLLQGKAAKGRGWCGLAVPTIPWTRHPSLTGTFGHRRVNLCCSHPGMRVELGSAGTPTGQAGAASPQCQRTRAVKVREDQGCCSVAFEWLCHMPFPGAGVLAAALCLPQGDLGSPEVFPAALTLCGPCTAHRGG